MRSLGIVLSDLFPGHACGSKLNYLDFAFMADKYSLCLLLKFWIWDLKFEGFFVYICGQIKIVTRYF